MRTIRTLLSWVLALFLIAAFVQSNIYPSGYALFEPAGRVVTSVVELFAALMLLLPWTRRFGAVIASVVMAAATALHMSPWLGREVPLSLDPENTATDGGILFMLSIAMLAASFLLVVIHPGKKNRRGG